MKLGIFSDIHGNVYAFEKMLQLLLKERCDRHIFLGDICGYYCYNDEIIDFLRLNHRCLISILGNHDKMFLDTLLDRDLEKKYIHKFGHSSLHLKKNIKRKNIDFLKELPSSYFISNFNLGFFHGSPWDHLEGYVYPDSSFTDFKKLKYKLVFLGHTHYSMMARCGKVTIINPGSVGQPRDGNNPSFAVYDTDSNKIAIKRFTYDSRVLIKEIKRRKESKPFLIEVLGRGTN